VQQPRRNQWRGAAGENRGQRCHVALTQPREVGATYVLAGDSFSSATGVVLIGDGGLRLLMSWIPCDIARFTPRRAASPACRLEVRSVEDTAE
jgi:hypothetical protein